MYNYQKSNRYFAQAAEDIKDLVESELVGLGATDVSHAYKGLYFNGDKEVLYKVNLYTRLINRIESVEKFNDLAYICEDFETFVFEIAEWGVDHIAGVDFFDSYKSYRDFTLNPELDIKKLDAFIKS